jgi:hypothetical protein
MPVIAMTREMGSGGRDVARGVSDKLGLRVILHEMVEHDLAEHMHVKESAVHHLLEGGATCANACRSAASAWRATRPKRFSSSPGKATS